MPQEKMIMDLPRDHSQERFVYSLLYLLEREYFGHPLPYSEQKRLGTLLLKSVEEYDNHRKFEIDHLRALAMDLVRTRTGPIIIPKAT